MRNYEHAFETLVSRGTPIGATALLERIENQSPDVGHLSEPRRQWSGLAVAAVAFAAVLAFGGLWALMARQGDDLARTVDEFGVEWIELRKENALIMSLAAGPGGLVQLDMGQAFGLEFSPDGKDWSKIELPGIDRLSYVSDLVASEDVWLALVTAGDTGEPAGAYVSSDGQTWSSVVLPSDLRDTISDVVSSGSGFLAIGRDFFGAGTTLWWSTDGRQWSLTDSLPPTDIGDAFVWATSAGIALTPSAHGPNPILPIYHTVDGTTWVEGSLRLPTEFDSTSHRWLLSIVEYAGGQWIAIGEVESTGARPHSHVWTSSDGIEWLSQGVPGFDEVEDRALSLRSQSAVIGNLLVVFPNALGVVEGEDGYLRGVGSSAPTGEIWATEDGVSWFRVLETDRDILGVGGMATNTGVLVGVWHGRLRSRQGIAPAPVETTTSPVVPPQELDPVGLELQDEILADGTVTENELQRALEGWKTCMEERGLVHVFFKIEVQGGWSSEYGSPDEYAGEAEDAACRASYVNRVETALFSQ